MYPKIELLAFAAHPDDIEISISGTLLKHKAAGLKIGIVDLTKGELGTRGNETIRSQESEKASQLLNLDIRVNLGLKDGFLTNDEASLKAIVTEIRKYRPNIVLINAERDRHPDHGKAHSMLKEACFLAGLPKLITEHNGENLEAWRPKNVFSYIQDYLLEPDILIDVTPYWKTRMDSLLAYSSQFYNPDSNEMETPISSKSFLDSIEGRAIQWGRLINCQYAEGLRKVNYFEVKLLTDLVS
jgi:bacillithiol biosynthesis deacetylase BshB1